MKKSDWFDEYMEYKMATSSEEKSSGGSGVGCNLTLIFGILVVLWLLSKLSS